MHDDDDTIGAMRHAFAAWLEVVTAAGASARLRQQQAPLPAPVANASREHFAAVGVKYTDTVPPHGRKYVGTGDLHVEHAPGGAHVAVGLALYEDDVAFWWIDGQPVVLPPGQPAGLQLDSIAQWLDAHTLAIQVGGLDHPLADPRVHTALGDMRGLLLHDAARSQSTVVLPAPDERWGDPVAKRQGRSVAIFAERDQPSAAPARVLVWP